MKVLAVTVALGLLVGCSMVGPKPSHSSLNVASTLTKTAAPKRVLIRKGTPTKIGDGFSYSVDAYAEQASPAPESENDLPLSGPSIPEALLESDSALDIQSHLQFDAYGRRWWTVRPDGSDSCNGSRRRSRQLIPGALGVSKAVAHFGALCRSQRH